ncbi:NHLP family bacteriocin export ABC transporter peptidase/permease/ATPase subunit [bacterium]|nr:NHLP family bacteriocin export ABC transporter peptidase/permease/ATPase subunit [bacterium]
MSRWRTPTVIQMEAVECGAASLAMILAYYGRWVGLDELRDRCDVSRDGSNALNLIKVARQFGLESGGEKCEPAKIRTMQLPVIVFWNLNHFLVVEGFSSSRVYLNDPASGPRSVSIEEFDDSFTGIVLTFKKTPEFKTGGSPPSAIKGLLRRFKGATSPLMYLLITSFMLVVPGLIAPAFLQIFVDQILGQNLHFWTMYLLLAMLLTALVKVALNALQGYILMRLEIFLSTRNSASFFWHMLNLPSRFFSTRMVGDLANRVSLNDKVASILAGKVTLAGFHFVMVGFYALVMACYDVTLMLITLALGGINVLTLVVVGRLRTDLNARSLADQGKLMGVTIGALSGIESVKASGRESELFAHWAGYQTRVLNASQNTGGTMALVGLLPQVANSLGNVALLGYGGWLVMHGVLTVGNLMALQTLQAGLLGPINELVELAGTLQEVRADLNRLDDSLDQPEQKSPPFDPGARVRLSGKVEFLNIAFGYRRLAPPLIQNFTLTIQPGSRVAVVGATGSGKSTLARLLTSLFEPWSGQILYDGIPVSELPRVVLSSNVALVDQEILLFEGSLRQNLSLWNSSISDEILLQAVRDACIYDTIMSRGGGLEGWVNEGGSNFSGGERQRLEIARALAAQPSILVMDEATSALDPTVELEIDRNIRSRGCTCVIIAHRLSTIRDADQIVVLHQGQVVQNGTHDQLMTSDGPYRTLVLAEPALA